MIYIKRLLYALGDVLVFIIQSLIFCVSLLLVPVLLLIHYVKTGERDDIELIKLFPDEDCLEFKIGKWYKKLEPKKKNKYDKRMDR